jgi:predicted amidophosphoribosyltransferase
VIYDYEVEEVAPLGDDETVCADCWIVYHVSHNVCPSCLLFGAPE